jgi:hypothetical protein
VEFVWDEESMTPQENQANIDFAKKFLLKYEFKLMKLMDWNVMLPTPLDFLRHSFQFAALFEGSLYNSDLPDMLFDSRYERGADTVLHQKYDTMMFAQAAAIIDRAVMDYHSLNFLGSQIAAAVFWMIYPKRGPKGTFFSPFVSIFNTILFLRLPRKGSLSVYWIFFGSTW